jgi:hypothetical protein
VSQVIGKDFRTKIPVFGDDASIQEAFSVYHFGVDNYTSQPIPDDSIEGHFRALNQRVSDSESAISGLGATFVEQVSLTSAPNIISPQTSGVVPLTVRGAFNQVSALQRWQTRTTSTEPSIGNDVIVFHPAGAASFQKYLNIGAVSQSTNIGLNISLENSAHRGVVVKGFGTHTGNLQEWQNSAGTVIARVDKDGKIFSNNGLTGTTTSEVITLTGTQTLTNKTFTNPTINGPTISNATISNTTITGSVITNAVSITLSGAQALTSRVRNVIVSTGNPTGGNDGDIWVRYLN